MGIMKGDCLGAVAMATVSRISWKYRRFGHSVVDPIIYSLILFLKLCFYVKDIKSICIFQIGV